METQQVHSLGDMIANGTTTSHADLWYNPALLGKRAQFGKLAKSINHFHLLQMALAKIFFQLYFNGENGTFIWCSYHINRKNVLNKAFWTTTFESQQTPEAGELRRENLTGNIHTWQLLVIWWGSGQNILVLFLCIFIKMIFPFQHLHMPVHGSENSIHWLSIHMVCIQWHHSPLRLPSWTSPVDHQNTVSQSLWG